MIRYSMPTKPGTYIYNINKYVSIKDAFDEPDLETISTEVVCTNANVEGFIMDLSLMCGKQVLHVWKDTPVAIVTCDPTISNMMCVWKVQHPSGKHIKTSHYGKYINDDYKPTLHPKRFTEWFSIGTTGAEEPAQALLDCCEKYSEVDTHKQQEFTKVYGLPTEQWNEGKLDEDCRRDAFVHTYALRNPKPRTKWANRSQIELPTNDDIFVSDHWHIDHQMRHRITNDVMYGRMYIPRSDHHRDTETKKIKVEVHFNEKNEVEKVIDTWGNDRLADMKSISFLEFGEE